MGDKMTPIPFGNLMEWILEEKRKRGSVFGVRKQYRADAGKTLSIFGEKIETPFGPAAGPNTQLAQNIVTAYLTGCRFFELKTVQILDGEDLPVNKPCILAEDECYNCEWSTELYVQQAYAEYVKAWVALKALAKEWQTGAPDGFVFNISVGYDLAGIQSEKIDTYIRDMIQAKDHPAFKECIRWLKENQARFKHLTKADIDAIPPEICRSTTVSTLHGCPPQEIESIASYLIKEKGLHTFVKCNPTLLGYETARRTMDEMGYDYVAFGDFHFKDDLQFTDAVPMFRRLQRLADERGLEFGVKITNTFPVDVTRNELPSEEMYMSGKSLSALSLTTAYRLSKEFDGKLRISYSGGADYFNIDKIYNLGIWPVTVATTLLKPGGYNRNVQMAQKLAAQEYRPFTGVDVEGLAALPQEIRRDPHHVKPIKPLPDRKLDGEAPLLDCFIAPCSEGCPIHQDIPAYVRLTREGKYREALEIILDKNPLPFMTGTLCSHKCMSKCTRNFYEEPVDIRGAKLQAAKGGYEAVMKYACDLEAAAEKKGILVHSKEASSEKERCLECSHICENCVDVCPNRANVAVQVPGCKAPVIVHVDYMCNECGNCNSFCPYSSAPYQNKFTLFANEKDFDNSGNQGFAVLDHDAMRVKVRLAGQTAVHELKSGGCSLHEGLKQTILEIEENYRYLYI